MTLKTCTRASFLAHLTCHPSANHRPGGTAPGLSAPLTSDMRLGTPSSVLRLDTPPNVLRLGTPPSVLRLGTPPSVLRLGTPLSVLGIGTLWCCHPSWGVLRLRRRGEGRRGPRKMHLEDAQRGAKHMWQSTSRISQMCHKSLASCLENLCHSRKQRPIMLSNFV